MLGTKQAFVKEQRDDNQEGKMLPPHRTALGFSPRWNMMLLDLSYLPQPL